MSDSKTNFFDTTVLGHPAGLFVLFFTEMWERFSFYGMRVLLVNFLTMAVIGYNPGWEWTTENAGALFGTYAGLLYLTPILGGLIADKYTGYRWAVVIGSIIMTLGHASMALETELSLYVGLALLVIGTGFFKPTMTSIVSEMYKFLPEKKDGAYTIFYMGVNAGAFFGMMLCGYLAERIGWSWGFGLAGIFMLLGTLQFWLAGPLFGSIGDVPSKRDKAREEEEQTEEEKNIKPNPFTLVDQILIAITSVIGFAYLINDPLSKIGGIDLFPFKIFGVSGQYVTVLFGLALFLILITMRISRYGKVVRDRMIAFIIFAFFTVFFWMAFEQGASSLVVFARDYVDRTLSGSSATIFNVVNILLTVVPLLIITYVLFLLGKRTFNRIPGSNIVLVICFLGVWGIVGWMLNRDWNTKAYQVSYEAVQTNITSNDYNASPERFDLFKEKILGGSFTAVNPNPTGDEKTIAIEIDSILYNGNFIKQETTDSKEEGAQEALNEKYITSITSIPDSVGATAFYTVKENKEDVVKKIAMSELYFDTPLTQGTKVTPGYNIVKRQTTIGEPIKLAVGDKVNIIHMDNAKTEFGYLGADALQRALDRGIEMKQDNGVIDAKVTEVKGNEVTITVSWFSILNSFFIIAFASMFSRWWDSKYNPSAAAKYALGLIIMGLGFGLLAYGAYGVQVGVKVSMVWLILAYLFHTLGELCLSPVGLSYVSKLVPARMIGFMFGMWYLAIAIGNKLAGVLGGEIDNITEQYSLSVFFLIFTIVPCVAGLAIMLLHPLLKKLMHGVK